MFDEQVDNLLRVQDNSASYLQWEEKAGIQIRDCKSLLVLSMTRVGGSATASTQISGASKSTPATQTASQKSSGGQK